MSNYKLCKGKHLRIEDRLIIEYGLDQNYTLKEIAERVGKDPTTISKEIKRNRFLKVSKKKGNDIQLCQHRRSCTKTSLCNNTCTKQGTSLNNRTQEEITLMMNHINNTARASLNENTPFKLAQMLLDNSLLDKLSLKYIPADEIHLKPALFKK